MIWDNQATWHYAVNDYDGPRAHRKVIAGHTRGGSQADRGR